MLQFGCKFRPTIPNPIPYKCPLSGTRYGLLIFLFQRSDETTELPQTPLPGEEFAANSAHPTSPVRTSPRYICARQQERPPGTHQPAGSAGQNWADPRTVL